MLPKQLDAAVDAVIVGCVHRRGRRYEHRIWTNEKTH